MARAVLLPRSTPTALAVLGLVGLAASGCGREEGPRPIEERREHALVGEEMRFGATSAERFRLRPMGAATAGPASASGPSLHWDTPAGWTEQPTSSLRQANFLVSGDPRAECYLTVLGGDGGGLLANVDRWRKQMSLPPLDPAELDALPTVEFFGEPAVRVAFDGTWAGMSGSEAESDYRLVGLLQVEPSRARFLKMVGPREVIAAAEPAFAELAASFHDASSHDGDHGGGAQPAPTASAPQRAPGALAWTDPEGWQRGGDRPMREVTFTVSGAEGEAECYVSVLGGDGGGALPNVNRWYDQMGQPPLGPAELEALPRIEMLGGEAILVRVAGSYTGMAGESVADASLLGTVRLLGDRSVFVKMIGPAEVVERERDAFERFCGSLRFGGMGS